MTVQSFNSPSATEAAKIQFLVGTKQAVIDRSVLWPELRPNYPAEAPAEAASVTFDDIRYKPKLRYLAGASAFLPKLLLFCRRSFGLFPRSLGTFADASAKYQSFGLNRSSGIWPKLRLRPKRKKSAPVDHCKQDSRWHDIQFFHGFGRVPEPSTSTV